MIEATVGGVCTWPELHTEGIPAVKGQTLLSPPCHATSGGYLLSRVAMPDWLLDGKLCCAPASRTSTQPPPKPM